MYHKISIRICSFLLVLFFIFQATTSEAITEKYRCIWRNDPATTMTIGWNQLSGENPVLLYDMVDFSQNADAYAYRQTPDRNIVAKGMNNHFVRLTGLQPDTKYFFIIKDSEGVSRRLWFRTAPDNPYQRLSIVAGGDSRNHWEARRKANLMVSKLRPHCVFFGGDMTGVDNTVQWKRWMNDWQLTIADDGRMTPIIPARGNHERDNKSITNMFDVADPNIYYATNFGGTLLRAYTLNSMMAAGGDQYKWLKKDLEDNDNTIWRFAQYHHPIRPHTAKKSDRQSQYKYWASLFHKHQVQLVVECDAHLCKTTWPLRPSYEKGHDMGFVRDDKTGTVYVGEGCWGAPLRPDDDDKKWTRNSGSFNQVKWIFVDQDKVEVRTVKVDNATSVASVPEYDIFQMPKGINIWKPSNGDVITIYRKSNIEVSTKVPELPTSTTPTENKQKTKKERKIKKSTAPLPPAGAPLVMGRLRAGRNQNTIEVKWNTLSQPPNTKCEVQRSTNGFDFYTISTLQLDEVRQKSSNYSVKDNDLGDILPPFLYYRLKHSFQNGTHTYSNKIQTKGSDWENYTILTPDKEKKTVALTYKLNKKTDVSILIFNKKGTIVHQKIVDSQTIGEHTRAIPIRLLQSGDYAITLEPKGEKAQYFKFAW